MKKFFSRLWQLITGRREEKAPEPVAPIAPPPPPPVKPKPVKLKRCPVMDKLMFTREQAAVARDRRMKAQPNVHLRIYCCEYCSTWHLTHLKRHRW